MELLWDIANTIVGANTYFLLLLAIVVPATAAFFIVRHLRKVKQDVHRRVMADPGSFSTTQLGATTRVVERAKRVVESMAELAGASDTDSKHAKALRAKLIQAGFYDKQAVIVYFGLRFVMALGGLLIVLSVSLFVTGLKIGPVRVSSHRWRHWWAILRHRFF